MRSIFILPLLVIGIKSHNDHRHQISKDLYPTVQGTSSDINRVSWTKSLSDFRKALLNGDRKSIKMFFDFPILNPGNDIWMVADMKQAARLSPDKIVPFKESDFDQYFNEILPIDLRKTFEKVDIEKLAKSGGAESPELTIVKPATSKMRASFSETKKTIVLSLITKSPDFGQYSIDFHFKILANQEIRFTHLKFNI